MTGAATVTQPGPRLERVPVAFPALDGQERGPGGGWYRNQPRESPLSAGFLESADSTRPRGLVRLARSIATRRTASQAAVGIMLDISRPSAVVNLTPSAAAMVGATSKIEIVCSSPPSLIPGPDAIRSPSTRCSPVRP